MGKIKKRIKNTFERTLEQRLYLQSRGFRDKLFSPITVPLKVLGVSPDFVSSLSVLLMVFFVYLVEVNLVWSSVLVGLLPVLDGLDGALARQVGQSEVQKDKGKFVDLICGLLSFIFMVFGMTRVGLVSGHWAVLLVSFLLLSKIFRSIVHGFDTRSDWRFRAVAGFLPTFFIFLISISFVLFAFFGVNFINQIFIFASTVLVLDAFHFYLLVLKKH